MREIGVAKDQRLSLNPAQISGACGRLMCCLRYEHEFYVQSRKRFPKEGKIVVLAHGEEKVLAVDIFRERLTLRSAEGETRVVALADFNEEMAAAVGGGAGLTDDAAFGDEEAVENGYEVSPELMYTSEHEVMLRREPIVSEPIPEVAATIAGEGTGEETIAEPSAEAKLAAERDESAARRRRGRRGGRRGRGGEPGQP